MSTPGTLGRADTALLLVFIALASLTNSTCADEALGRLFFAPERRQLLDRQRELNIQQTQEVIEEPTVTVNGVVVRSSGRRTAWVNGVAQNENETPSGVSVSTDRYLPGHITIETGTSSTTQTSVGNTIIRSTGETSDALNGGSITIKRQRRAP